jgi:hypothetical protein
VREPYTNKKESHCRTKKIKLATLHRAMVAKTDNAACSSDVSFKNLTTGRPNKVSPDSARDQASLASTSSVSRAKSFVFSAISETIVISAKLDPQVN